MTRRAPRLPRAARDLLGLIEAHGGEVRMPYAELADVLNVDKRTVIRTTKKLGKLGLLEREGAERSVGVLRLTGDISAFSLTECHQSGATPGTDSEADDDRDLGCTPILAGCERLVVAQRALESYRAGRRYRANYRQGEVLAAAGITVAQLVERQRAMVHAQREGMVGAQAR